MTREVSLEPSSASKIGKLFLDRVSGSINGDRGIKHDEHSGPAPWLEGAACWLLFIACAAYSVTRFNQAATIAIDDTYIYFTAARNILEGYGSVLNPGDTHSVSTGPGWAVVLAAISSMTGGGEGLFRGAIATGTAFLLVGSLSLTSLLQPRLGAAAGLAPLAVFTAPGLPYYSGLETNPAVGMLLAIPVLMYRYRRPTAAFFLLGVAYTVRPDLALLGLPLGMTLIIRLRSEYAKTGKSPWTDLVRCGLAGAATPLLWHSYAYVTMGSLLPQGLHAKSVQGISGMFALFVDGLPKYLEMATTGHGLLQLSALVGLYFLARDLWPILLFCAVRFLAYWAMTIADYGWYSYDIVVIGRVCMVFGLYHLTRLGINACSQLALRLANFISSTKRISMPRIWPRVSSTLAIGLVIAVFWPATDGTAGAGLPRLWSGGFTSSQIEVYQRVGGWLKGERSAELAGSHLLAQEVGVLSYGLPGVAIHDIVGITDPEITTSTIGDWNFYVNRHRPKWLVPMFDRWGGQILFLDSNENVLPYRRVFVAAPGGRSRQAPLFERQAMPMLPAVSAGDPLKFGAEGSGNQYIAGAYVAAEIGTWLIGGTSGIVIPVPSDSPPLRVKLAMYPYLHSTAVKRQRLRIWEAGSILVEHEFTVAAPEDIVFEPQIRDGSIRVRLVLPDVAIPALTGTSINREPISFMMLRLTLEAI